MVKDSILLLHAYLGCDITRNILGLGKGKFFKYDLKSGMMIFRFYTNRTQLRRRSRKQVKGF